MLYYTKGFDRNVMRMLSFLVGGSTHGYMKPAAYGTIKVHKMENGEVRKIARDVQTILSAFLDRMT
uniref:Uncharacterized protein n=1 Tax=Candidatus Methanogaster sp. ANME-2c ERB4 TaxID=2759911 RepID=A0A7G9YKY4_9EURY|nr:hypothetical protein AMAKCJMG_00002 [Methanosarcinales archaeon ANME-2c ERB4]